MNTTKIYFFIFLLFSSALTNDSVRLGIKVGLNSSVINSKIKEEQPFTWHSPFNNERISPQFGFYLQAFNFSYFNFESELIYLQKGGEDEFELRTVQEPLGTGELLYYDHQFDLLQVNINCRPNYTFSKYNIFGVYGLFANYLLKSTGPSFFSDLNEINYGFRTGRGIEFKDIISVPFSMEFIYERDISKFVKNKSVEYWTRNYQIKFGFQLI